MRAPEVLYPRWIPVVRARMYKTLECSDDAALVHALDIRKRQLLPGIRRAPLTNMLIALGPEDRHAIDALNRAVLHTLLWSGLLGSDDPGYLVELVVRQQVSEAFVHRRSTLPMLQEYFGSDLRPHPDHRGRLLVYFVLAVLHIYEEGGGDPMKTFARQQHEMGVRAQAPYRD